MSIGLNLSPDIYRFNFAFGLWSAGIWNFSMFTFSLIRFHISLNFGHIVWKSPKISHFNGSSFRFSKLPKNGLQKWTLKMNPKNGPQKWTLKMDPNMDYFWHFFSTQNVNVARFARSVKNETFIKDFQTLCLSPAFPGTSCVPRVRKPKGPNR